MTAYPEEVENLLALIESTHKICPQPDPWYDLWMMLPNRKRDGYQWVPPLPLILDSWWYTSDHEKHERFLMHIHYAVENDFFEVIDIYLRHLTPEQWHTTDDNE